MRKTKELSNKDRNTKENRKMAKLLTAMTTVIATNGYILYGDNTSDSAKEDFNHILYDFYSFEIGKPTSGRIKVSNGVGLKEHKLGFIAYNITSREHTLKRPNGDVEIIKPYSGLFCKEVGKRKCLPLD